MVPISALLRPAALENRFHQKCRGALAVGSGDAGDRQPFGRTADRIRAQPGRARDVRGHLRPGDVRARLLGRESVTTATAPAAMARSMNLLPSLVSPRMATKASPGFTCASRIRTRGRRVAALGEDFRAVSNLLKDHCSDYRAR